MNQTINQTIRQFHQFSPAAQRNIEETCTDWEGDIERLRAGLTTIDALRSLCLDGADPDRIEGWEDYLATVVVLDSIVSNADIKALRREALEANDLAQAAICTIALHPYWTYASARVECARVIRAAADAV